MYISVLDMLHRAMFPCSAGMPAHALGVAAAPEISGVLKGFCS